MSLASETLASLAAQERVRGVVVADSNGLCMGGKGTTIRTTDVVDREHCIEQSPIPLSLTPSFLLFAPACAARGNLLPASSAHVHSLMEVGSKLSEDGERPTMIHIQTSDREILIAHAEGFTTAVARSAPAVLPQQQQAQQQAQQQPPAAHAESAAEGDAPAPAPAQQPEPPQ